MAVTRVCLCRAAGYVSVDVVVASDHRVSDALREFSYGVGYHLTIVKVPDVADSHRLEALIRDVIPQCQVRVRLHVCLLYGAWCAVHRGAWCVPQPKSFSSTFVWMDWGSFVASGAE